MSDLSVMIVKDKPWEHSGSTGSMGVRCMEIKIMNERLTLGKLGRPSRSGNLEHTICDPVLMSRFLKMFVDCPF